MNKKRSSLLANALALTVLLFILHVIALRFHLYYSTWWMDVINHFLGGVIATLLGACIFMRLINDSKHKAWFLLGFVIMVGLLWEVFEVTFNLTFVSSENYWSDTSLDIIMDLVGMLAGYKYFITK